MKKQKKNSKNLSGRSFDLIIMRYGTMLNFSRFSTEPRMSCNLFLNIYIFFFCHSFLDEIILLNYYENFSGLFRCRAEIFYDSFWSWTYWTVIIPRWLETIWYSFKYFSIDFIRTSLNVLLVLNRKRKASNFPT